MGLFDFFKKKEATSIETIPAHTIYYNYSKIIDAAYKEMKAAGKDYYWDYKPSEASVFSDQVLPLSLKNKVKFIIDAVDHVHSNHRDNNSFNYDDKKWIRCRIADTFMRHLLKTKLELDNGDAENIATAFLTHNVYSHGNVFHWPVSMLLAQIEKLIKARGMSEQLTATISKLKQTIESQTHHD